MGKYQITYNTNGKTLYSELHADNYQNIVDVFYELFSGELLEIREILHEDKAINEDDKNYIHSANIKVISSSKNYGYSFKIPKLKKTISEEDLKNMIFSYVKIDSLKPDSLKITTNYKL
jgi:hypothetical protein